MFAVSSSRLSHVQQFLGIIIQKDDPERILVLFDKLPSAVHLTDVLAPAHQLDLPATLQRSLAHGHEALRILCLRGVASCEHNRRRLVDINNRLEDLEVYDLVDSLFDKLLGGVGGDSSRSFRAAATSATARVATGVEAVTLSTLATPLLCFGEISLPFRKLSSLVYFV